MTASTSRQPRGIATGFTLIELLAVVAMFALLAGIALPNFGLRSRRAMEDEARQLAADLEFARQRSVMTGIPHRLVIDVEGGGYWLEWLVSEARALGEEEAEVGLIYEMGDLAQVPMAPPAAAQLSYHALPGDLGRTSLVREILRIDGVETADGFFEQGLVNIVFERNGTSEASRILLSDEDGNAIAIEVAPFADTVRIRHEEI
jgi:prepilin-type N-terminal cleavage/methylation domain-containing protein